MTARKLSMTPDAIRKRLKRAGIGPPLTDTEILINNHHHEHPGLGLWLTAGQVRELAGCAHPECADQEGLPS